MTRSGRTTWGLVMTGVIAATAATLTIRQSTAAAGETQVEPTERNCWDPTTWGDPPSPRTWCEVPEEPDSMPPRPSAPVFVSDDLTHNRGYTMPVGTFQVVTFYDGDAASRPTLRIEYTSPTSGSGWIEVERIHASTSDRGRIGTFEYDLVDARPTGRFEIAGIVPNGVVDGLAFGLFWRDARGFHVLRSTAPEPADFATFVGTWPIGLNDESFERRTPQLKSVGARQQAKTTIYGAEYIQNGTYLMTIQERIVKVAD